MREHHDIVVIGGGQAGLAMSAVLQQRGLEHVVLERRAVGERWRSDRWESLRFQFPNWSLELPGYRYSGDDPDGFAHWREIVRLLEDYAASVDAPVREHTEVSSVQADDGGFVLSVPEVGRSAPVTSSSQQGRSKGPAYRSSPRAYPRQ